MIQYSTPLAPVGPVSFLVFLNISLEVYLDRIAAQECNAANHIGLELVWWRGRRASSFFNALWAFIKKIKTLDF